MLSAVKLTRMRKWTLPTFCLYTCASRLCVRQDFTSIHVCITYVCASRLHMYTRVHHACLAKPLFSTTLTLHCQLCGESGDVSSETVDVCMRACACVTGCLWMMCAGNDVLYRQSVVCGINWLCHNGVREGNERNYVTVLWLWCMLKFFIAFCY